jgi:TAT (twin-arginine translocation) pathway signal sequence
MNRRDFLQTSASLAAAAATGQAHAHPHHQATAALENAAGNDTASGSPSGPIVSGSGDFRYEYVAEKLVLPDSVKMKNGHGLCMDKAGNIYFTFEPQKVEAETRCLVRFAPDGTNAVLLGSDNTLAHGVPHGLNIHTEKDGKQVLYHANNVATIHKTTLEGEVLWTQKWSPQMGNFKPTDTVVAPEGGGVFVADGYGSSMIHLLKEADGIYAGKSWGGLGKEHGELSCPHGISYDPRRKMLLIADRSNKRFEYYTLNGFYHSTFEAKEMAAPCNADIQGDYALVPDLNGPMVVLDKDNQVVSVIEVGKLLGSRGFVHPHDAIWLANGDIAVCTWNPGRLGYWKRLAKA